MGPLLALFVVGSILVTVLWINKNNQDYLIQQQTLRQQDQKQFMLIKDMLRNRLESWFGSFIHFQTRLSDDNRELSSSFASEFDYMQLNWQINNLWLFETDKRLLFSTTKSIPFEINRDVDQVINYQTSLSHIRCHTECQQYISVPMLTGDGSIVVLSLTHSLLEALSYLNRSTLAKLAILRVDKPLISELSSSYFLVKNMKINPPINVSNRRHVEEVLNALPDSLYLDDILDSGYKLQTEQGSFLLNLLPVEQDIDNNTYLLFVHDISEAANAHARYQNRIATLGALVGIVATLVLFFISVRLKRRLVKLAQQLPLLAEKKYDDFEQAKVKKSGMFVDEIELLQDSASLLGKELSSLDSILEKNTKQLEDIAMNDWLTGLPNRNRLNIKLQQLIPATGIQHRKLTVMFLDFDKFRSINDTHGHDMGDRFLVHAAKRISDCLTENDMLFRFGGDEFVLVVTEHNKQESAPILATRVIDSFRQPIAINELLFYTSASIGMASTDSADTTIEDLIRKSDLAMYHSKDAGGCQYSIFNEKMQASALRKVEIENEVRNALEQEQFTFALQPQVHIATGKLIGFEALIRWLHPERGFVPPDEFIPLIENTEHMISLGYWGMEQAFLILQKLDDLGYTGLKVAVNLSASQFLDPDLVPFLEGRLKTYERSPEQIELELTERTLVADVDKTLQTMSRLKALGFVFSIDDFGTGYSSLAYLKQMPVDIIKIDRSFVAAMDTNSADMQIVSSIIAMVNKLGMRVVAEGIETPSQLAMLNNLSCEIGQGYFISRPIPEKDLYQLLPTKLNNGVWDDLLNLNSE